jgi:hypothetical protein
VRRTKHFAIDILIDCPATNFVICIHLHSLACLALLHCCCIYGCADNVVDDPAEYNELSHSHPEQLQAMLQRYAALRPSLFAPDRGSIDPRACEAAVSLYGIAGQGGFW